MYLKQTRNKTFENISYTINQLFGFFFFLYKFAPVQQLYKYVNVFHINVNILKVYIFVIKTCSVISLSRFVLVFEVETLNIFQSIDFYLYISHIGIYPPKIQSLHC